MIRNFKKLFKLQNIMFSKDAIKYQRNFKTSYFLYNEKKVLEDIKKSKFLKT